jgi:hypothetical protein
MEVVSNNKLDLKEYFGHIIVMHDSRQDEKLDELKEVLDASCYQYFCLPILDEDVDSSVVFEDTNIFNGCVCLIPVFSKRFFEADNTFLKSQFWYYIGYVKSTHSDAILPYCTDKSEKASLNGTPLHKLDFKNNVDDLMVTIQEKYSSKLLCYNYYENKTINKFASKRIMYRDLCIKFKIYQTAFENAKEYYQSCTSRRISDNSFDEFIASEILGGCRVLSFGSVKNLTAPLMPYRDEVITKVDDYPKTITGKKSYTKLSSQEQQETGVRAELTMNILMPVHKLLGTNFKCFITLKNNKCPIYLLLSLFEGDFIGKDPEFNDYLSEDNDYWMQIYPKETHIDQENGRLYISTGLTSTKTADESLGIGAYEDYMFPQ